MTIEQFIEFENYMDAYIEEHPEVLQRAFDKMTENWVKYEDLKIGDKNYVYYVDEEEMEAEVIEKISKKFQLYK